MSLGLDGVVIVGAFFIALPIIGQVNKRDKMCFKYIFIGKTVI